MKLGLPAIVRPDAQVLILGSLPGDASIAAQQYYAHPRNDFWRLMSGVTGCNLSALEYPARLEALQIAGVALWDVVAEAQRPGSLDNKIRNAQANDLGSFASSLRHLRAIAFNGKKAASLAVNAFDGLPVDIINLPSSSPAYTLDAETKEAAWAVLAQFLAPIEFRAGGAIS